jgi:hypothetical protein
LLLDHGADANAKTMDHSTPLHYASVFDHFDIAKALLERGANVHERNSEGRTPLQLAAIQGNQEIMRLLSEDRVHGDVDS